MLNVVVCVKAVPDPKEADQIRIDPVTKSLARSNVPLVLNPLDKNAMEAALQLKEQVGAQVTVVSMGPAEAAKMVKECLALGADQGVLLSDPAFAGADAYATAYTLARGIVKIGRPESSQESGVGVCANGSSARTHPNFSQLEKIRRPDVIFCGMASSDGATEWVGPMLATILGMPVVTGVNEIVAAQGSQWRVKASIENGYRLVQVHLPAVLTVTRELNTPRALSFSGIIRARQKEILEWGIKELGVEEDAVGLKGSPTLVSEMATRQRKRQVAFITGTREEKVDRLIQKLVDAGFL